PSKAPPAYHIPLLRTSPCNHFSYLTTKKIPHLLFVGVRNASLTGSVFANSDDTPVVGEAVPFVIEHSLEDCLPILGDKFLLDGALRKREFLQLLPIPILQVIRRVSVPIPGNVGEKMSWPPFPRSIT
ncbi:MAG: hypothetical protein AB1733_06270, partial [Thermodesulfobacteriota bacterium]